MIALTLPDMPFVPRTETLTKYGQTVYKSQIYAKKLPDFLLINATKFSAKLAEYEQPSRKVPCFHGTIGNILLAIAKELLQSCNRSMNGLLFLYISRCKF